MSDHHFQYPKVTPVQRPVATPQAPVAAASAAR